jgi:hypothetical protein
MTERLCVARDLATIAVTVKARDVVFLKGLIEAHDGLAEVRATSGGDLEVAFPEDRRGEVTSLLSDLAREITLWVRVPRGADAP